MKAIVVKPISCWIVSEGPPPPPRSEFGVKMLETPFKSQVGPGVLRFSGAASYSFEWAVASRTPLPLFPPQSVAEVLGPDAADEGRVRVSWKGPASWTKYVVSVLTEEAPAFVDLINGLWNTSHGSQGSAAARSVQSTPSTVRVRRTVIVWPVLRQPAPYVGEPEE
jgi:hypothetical protein